MLTLNLLLCVRRLLYVDNLGSNKEEGQVIDIDPYFIAAFCLAATGLSEARRPFRARGPVF